MTLQLTSLLLGIYFTLQTYRDNILVLLDINLYSNIYCSSGNHAGGYFLVSRAYDDTTFDDQVQRALAPPFPQQENGSNNNLTLLSAIVTAGGSPMEEYRYVLAESALRPIDVNIVRELIAATFTRPAKGCDLSCPILFYCQDEGRGDLKYLGVEPRGRPPGTTSFGMFFFRNFLFSCKKTFFCRKKHFFRKNLRKKIKICRKVMYPLFCHSCFWACSSNFDVDASNVVLGCNIFFFTDYCFWWIALGVSVLASASCYRIW